MDPMITSSNGSTGQSIGGPLAGRQVGCTASRRRTPTSSTRPQAPDDRRSAGTAGPHHHGDPRRGSIGRLRPLGRPPEADRSGGRRREGRSARDRRRSQTRHGPWVTHLL